MELSTKKDHTTIPEQVLEEIKTNEEKETKLHYLQMRRNTIKQTNNEPQAVGFVPGWAIGMGARNIPVEPNHLLCNKSGPHARDIKLDGAEDGKVLVRFPPEPSGYLHIGHSKAALLNEHFRTKYHGRLLVRFDDTNPQKEKAEFEKAILTDLRALNIKWDMLSHTSDFFDLIFNMAVKMIREGKAYIDNTPLEQMRKWCMDGVASPRRTATIKENLKWWNGMVSGSPEGLTSCLRAKINMTSTNKCLRDPVMYRCNATPHHRTGTRWKVYPTYDFACPIVDSHEGVTHVLRTSEYVDREEQFIWFCTALNIRKPYVWDYSRLNFEYTIMSKRYLTQLVEQKLVIGWDDPRFPTVRGLIRRGLTVAALKQYILEQGASRRVTMQAWDRLWNANDKILDLTVPRYTALASTNLVHVSLITDSAITPSRLIVATVPRHKKVPKLGTKSVWYGPTLWLEQADASACMVGEEITLMDWGNAFVHTIIRHPKSNVVKAMQMELHLIGSVKTTSKKLTWLADSPHVIKVTLVDFGPLITVPAFNDTRDKIEDVFNRNSWQEIEAMGDPNLRTLNIGDILQFERRGFYRLNAMKTDAEGNVHVTMFGANGNLAIKQIREFKKNG